MTEIAVTSTGYQAEKRSWLLGPHGTGPGDNRGITIDASLITLVRTASVTTTATSTAITAGAGTFSASDVGASITGTGIPAGATIASVTSGTAATLSVAATAAGTVTATITPTGSPGTAYYPNGYLPSGTAISPAGGLYSGTGACAGLLFSSVRIGSATAKVGGALVNHGFVNTNKLPFQTGAGSLGAGGVAALPLIIFTAGE